MRPLRDWRRASTAARAVRRRVLVAARSGAYGVPTAQARVARDTRPVGGTAAISTAAAGNAQGALSARSVRVVVVRRARVIGVLVVVRVRAGVQVVAAVRVLACRAVVVRMRVPMRMVVAVHMRMRMLVIQVAMPVPVRMLVAVLMRVLVLVVVRVSGIGAMVMVMTMTAGGLVVGHGRSRRE